MGPPPRQEVELSTRRVEGADARSPFVESSLLLSTLFACLALALALAGLAGWAFDNLALARLHPSLPPMQPNTAFGLAAGAVAVLISRSGLSLRVRRMAASALAIITLVFGAAVLAEYVLGWDLGIDRIFFPELVQADRPYPGRPMPQSALSFILVGVGLLLLQLPRSPVQAAQTASLLVLANAVIALTGYVFGVGALYRFPVEAPHTGMSVPAALAFASISLAMLCSRPSEGMMALVTSDSASAAIARRILAILIVGWPLVGGLTLIGTNAGWYDLATQASVFSLVMLGLLLWVTWQAAQHGDREEQNRKAATEAAKKAREEADVLGARVRNLVEQASDGILVADLEGRYTEVNKAGCHMLGYEREEIIGKTVLDLLLPEDLSRLMQHKARLLCGDVEVAEWTVRRKDGTLLPVEVSAKILPDGQWQAFIRDITERKKFEAELRQAIKNREDILAIVSHDLGNPLAAASMMAGRLRRTDPYDSEKVREYASAIETSTNQMTTLIKDLLLFAKLQSGTFLVSRHAERAADMVAAAVSMVRAQAEERRQALTMDVPTALPDVACDKSRIVQALSNLLGNAVKYTPEGGAIIVRGRAREGELVMSVSDNGPGIPPEALPRIFDRYWQAEATNSVGAGLGLAIAKGIAEAHGGRLWAETELGVGSTFYLAVPMGQSAKRRPTRAASATIGGRR
jgi:PAS domain S-box-containing protein